MEIKTCGKDDFKSTIDLINRTFCNNEEPTMQQAYPLLLSEDNLNHMWIVKEDNKTVASVNYYVTEVLIQGVSLKTASIGAVCTDEGYMGRGYSSQLLIEAEKQMLKENVRLMLVSGGRDLYLRRGCVNAGKYLTQKIYAHKSDDSNISISKFTDGMFEEIVSIYNRDDIRYYRSYDEFNSMFKSLDSVQTFIIRYCGQSSAYVMLSMYREKSSWNAYLREYSGDSSIISRALSKILCQYSIENIDVECADRTNMGDFISKNGEAFDIVNMQGTVKIVDFKGIMEDLIPYFSQYVPNEIIKNISFDDKEGYTIKICDEILKAKDIGTATKLVFGDKDETFSAIIGDNLKNKPIIDKFVKIVFPLPFPHPGNLNHQ